MKFKPPGERPPQAPKKSATILPFVSRDQVPRSEPQESKPGTAQTVDGTSGANVVAFPVRPKAAALNAREKSYAAVAGREGNSEIVWRKRLEGKFAERGVNLSIVLRPGASSNEDISFLTQIEEHISRMSQEFIARLANFRIAIVQMQEATGLPMQQKRIAVEMTEKLGQIQTSTWEGHLANSASWDGEATLAQILEQLAREQERQLTESSGGIVGLISSWWNWLGRRDRE